MRRLQRLFPSSSGRGFGCKWLESKQRKENQVLGSEKTHIVPEEGLVPDCLPESQHEGPITGSCDWGFLQLGLSSGGPGVQSAVPNSFEASGALVTDCLVKL